jgi:talin
MLFCQSHEAIVSGLYPCTLDEAVQLAATQFQINFGDHNPSIHKPGFLKYISLKRCVLIILG